MCWDIALTARSSIHQTDYDVCVVCGSLAECAHDREQETPVDGHAEAEAAGDAENSCDMVTIPLHDK